MCVSKEQRACCILLLFLLVASEYRSQVSAQMNVTTETYIPSGNSSCDLLSYSVHCKHSGEAREEIVSDLDFNFDAMQEDLMALFSFNGQEDGVTEHQTNGSDVENLKNGNGILNRGGRHYFLNFFKFVKIIFKKNMGTLLFAYKLKFLTLFPLLLAGLLVIVKASGMAGFFFALFIATVAVKSFSH